MIGGVLCGLALIGSDVLTVTYPPTCVSEGARAQSRCERLHDEDERVSTVDRG